MFLLPLQSMPSSQPTLRSPPVRSSWFWRSQVWYFLILDVLSSTLSYTQDLAWRKEKKRCFCSIWGSLEQKTRLLVSIWKKVDTLIPPSHEICTEAGVCCFLKIAPKRWFRNSTRPFSLDCSPKRKQFQKDRSKVDRKRLPPQSIRWVFRFQRYPIYFWFEERDLHEHIVLNRTRWQPRANSWNIQGRHDRWPGYIDASTNGKNHRSCTSSWIHDFLWGGRCFEDIWFWGELEGEKLISRCSLHWRSSPKKDSCW